MSSDVGALVIRYTKSIPNIDGSITPSCCQVNKQSIKLAHDDLTVKFILHILKYLILN